MAERHDLPAGEALHNVAASRSAIRHVLEEHPRLQRFALILSAVGGLGVVLVLLWLAAESPERRVLASAGDSKLTAAEFQRLAEQAGMRYALPPDSAKLALAEDWLRRALMVEAAKRNPALIDSLVRRYREQVEHQVLMNALAQQITTQNPPVSEAEVRRFWESRGQESNVQVVYALDERMMRAGQGALANGEPFDSVADRFSVPGLLPPGGYLGWVAPGALINPLDYAVQSTPVGQIAGPFEAPGEGWFLIRVLERRPRERAPYETERAQLRSVLAQRKQRTTATRAFRALREQYDVRTRDEGVSALYQSLNTPLPIQGFPGITTMPPPPTPEERATVLGTWDGGPGYRGEYTLGEALDDLDAGRGERPNPAMTPALDQWVSSRILEKVAEMEARRRHLHEEPAVAAQIRSAVEDYILESLDSEIRAVSQPTPEDLQAVYEQNVAAIAPLRSVRVQHLTLPDSTSAARAFDQVRRHPTLMDAVLLASAGMQVQEEVVPFPNPDPLWSMMEGMFRQAPVGAYFPPMRIASGAWRLVQLTGREMPAPTMNELSADVQQNLYQAASDRARQRRLMAYTDSLRTVIPTTLDRDAIVRERWPMAQLGTGG